MIPSKKTVRALLARSYGTAIGSAILASACTTDRAFLAFGEAHPASAEAVEGASIALPSMLTTSEPSHPPSGVPDELPTEATAAHEHAVATRAGSTEGVEAQEADGVSAAAGHAHGLAQAQPPPAARSVQAAEAEQGAAAQHHHEASDTHAQSAPGTALGDRRDPSAATDELTQRVDRAQPASTEQHRHVGTPQGGGSEPAHPLGTPSDWRLWEIHPKLVSFPIAFVIGGVLLELFAVLRRRASLFRVATGLLFAGFLTGLLAIGGGLLAYFTVPTHTPEAHELMLWHGGVQASSFTLLAIALLLRRARPTPPIASTVLATLAAVLLAVGAHFGGKLVFRGATGVSPELLAPELREGHGHDHPEAEHSTTEARASGSVMSDEHEHHREAAGGDGPAARP
jgi:uncharacterized membrane protein